MTHIDIAVQAHHLHLGPQRWRRRLQRLFRSSSALPELGWLVSVSPIAGQVHRMAAGEAVTGACRGLLDGGQALGSCRAAVRLLLHLLHRRCF